MMPRGWQGTAGHGAAALFAALIRPELGLCAAALFAGRELAQAEYRYIEAHGGRRADCPWWCGLLPEAWTRKGLADWLVPLGLACGVWLIGRFSIL